MPDSWSAVEDYWPRRLLHIASKTSIEKQGPHTYTDPEGNAHEKPRYSILSYTWGRFQIKQGPTLRIKHTPWKIPAIDPNHFTVDSFEKILNKLAENSIQWAWIDVACIDQENEEVKADEIGRQAAIFQNAEKAFVWLSSLHPQDLAPMISTIIEDSLEISSHVNERFATSTLEVEDLATSLDSDLEDNLLETRGHMNEWNTTSALAVKQLVTRLDSALEAFFADKWFSSLWTLQEIVLRKDALALSRDGDPIPWNQGYPMFFAILVNHCQNLYQDLQGLDDLPHQPGWLDSSTTDSLGGSDEETVAHIENMKKLILSAGFYYLFSDNPNVQYGTAQYRKTRDPEDRIYGIMQIYNLKVGKSARPRESPKLEELRVEFGAEINTHCPIMGQSYIHTVETLPKITWCITEMSTVPYQFRAYKEPHKQCSISVSSDGVATVRGRCCPFSELVDMHSNSSPPLQLFLDHYIISKLAFRPNRLLWPYKKDDIDSYPLLCEMGQDLWVLLLGDVLSGQRPAGSDRTQVGLLIARDKQNAQATWVDVPFHRCGICAWWESDPKQLQWRDVELSLK
ncbi:hypothetical protein FHL15_000503 [Xylaria flabelliformis]|uniref:Heterokaryon incompatibility domain-containing protein n=1 Tax=Xylaria flabelliformis TaxID=2512241 RepID=A0A553IE09_9PEZI|nr:hypothetical protein FHL15_000503 [Xylaria flabelliformis]